jgi:hypothetical protein
MIRHEIDGKSNICFNIINLFIELFLQIEQRLGVVLRVIDIKFQCNFTLWLTVFLSIGQKQIELFENLVITQNLQNEIFLISFGKLIKRQILIVCVEINLSRVSTIKWNLLQIDVSVVYGLFHLLNALVYYTIVLSVCLMPLYQLSHIWVRDVPMGLHLVWCGICF